VTEMERDHSRYTAIRETTEARMCRASLDMELAGLEPATSWVRFGRAPRSNRAHLQVF
jgi:hypothetical protein